MQTHTLTYKHCRLPAVHEPLLTLCLCRDHVHMNSTKFHTLTEFVKYLGRTGKCRVDETEKGWFISLIQEDPMEKLSTERRLKRDRRVPSPDVCQAALESCKCVDPDVEK